MQKIVLTFIIFLLTSSLYAQKLDVKQGNNIVVDLLETYKVSKDSSVINQALSLAYESKNDSIMG